MAVYQNRDLGSQASSTKTALLQRRAWRISPEEDYIWSMRFYKGAVVSETPDSRRTSEISSCITPRLTIRKSASGSIPFVHPFKIQKQLKIFASFLPDEVLRDMNNYAPRQIECCLLYGQITGMHSLVDRYHKMKADYKLKLSNQLNQFMGSMVQEILSNGGDIIKYTPTAMVVIWKCTKASYITENVHIALDCALVIQKHYGKFILESGEKLKVDFSITAGTVFFSLIGNDMFSRFLIFGPIYEDCRRARKTVAVDNIIISPRAMQFIHSFEYNLEKLEGGSYFKVTGLTRMWKQVRRHDYRESIQGPTSSFVTLATTHTNTSTSRNLSLNEFFLRPFLNTFLDNATIFIEKIGKFFQEGIRDGIMSDEPIENLVELRDISVATIYITTSLNKCNQMLKFTDEIYKKVYRYADKFKGFVNYVSILDNSTMMGIAFGLKSTAHVMQQRSSLKCVYGIMGSLTKDERTTGVTVGISTGKAYYTIIGHSLRQDLTLFGKTLTDSISLCLAVRNKIVCDQDTFIHSRMKASCFKLLIGTEFTHHSFNVESFPDGHIYQLLSDDTDEYTELPFYDQPLIGRDREIIIYENLISRFVRNTELKFSSTLRDVPNVLQMKAYPKEGKTRLLHEMIRITNPLIPVFLISLKRSHVDMPYFFIRKLFSMSFNDLSSPERVTREKALKERLSDMPREDLMWALNPVFRVEFPELQESDYSIEKEFQITLKILKYLCYRTFPIKSLVAADNVEYLDEESSKIIPSLLETKTFFLLMTRNRDYTLFPNKFLATTKIPNMVKMKVQTLSPNYYSALACQHFRVFAVPLDLVYFLQKKSNGNIGYIKNVLTNLNHRGYFTIKRVSYMEIIQKALITPSMNLIIPMTSTEKDYLMMFIVQKGRYDTNEFKRILWYIFVESFQNEKFYRLREKIYETVLKSNEIPACFLRKNLEMSDGPDDLTEINHITRVFELLTYPEQMILKHCSVLGDYFPRVALEHVLNLDYYSSLATAIQSFFEMGIVCCGRGDFSETNQFVVMRQKRVDPRSTDDKMCKCRGLFIKDRLFDLPDYAYCGLIRFKYTRFREIVYDQLRENQKVDLHTKILVYLQEETKRCRSCGRDAFDFNRGKRLDDYGQFVRDRRDRRFSMRFDYEFDSMIRTNLHDLVYDEATYGGTKHSTLSRNLSRMSLDSSYCTLIENPVPLGPAFMIKKIFLPMSISKLKEDTQLVRTFSTNDFTFCECTQILIALHRESVIHCRGSGQLIKLLKHLQEYAYLCIQQRNISEAHIGIRKAFECIDDIFETDNPPPKWKRNLYEGKLHTISALAYKELGMVNESLNHLKIALEKYKIKFPRGKISKFIHLASVKLQQILTFYAFPEIHTKRLSFCICEYYVDVAEVLDLYAKYLMARMEWEEAELIASWALYKALNAQTSFVQICDCFSNMILISIHKRDNYMTIALEIHALRYCYRKTNRVERWELNAVCGLYMSIILAKLIRSELDFCVHLGYVIIRMGASLNDTDKLMKISSPLVIVLLAKLYLQEAASLLLELEFCSDNIDDFGGQVWFHAQALLFHMETGYSIVPYEQCMSFIEIQAIKKSDIQRNDGVRRLTVLMWLWCLRNEQWERARRFEGYVEASLDVPCPETLKNKFTMTYVLEGFMLLYVQKHNKGNMREVTKILKIINDLKKSLIHESEYHLIMKPRLYIVIAYYYYIMSDERSAAKNLKLALSFSQIYDQPLFEEYAKFLTKAWRNELPKKKLDFWKKHCEENNLIFYQEFDMNVDEIGFYAFPVPRYF